MHSLEKLLGRGKGRTPSIRKKHGKLTTSKYRVNRYLTPHKRDKGTLVNNEAKKTSSIKASAPQRYAGNYTLSLNIPSIMSLLQLYKAQGAPFPKSRVKLTSG